MGIGGAVKRLAFTTVGGGLGAVKGFAKGIADSPNVSRVTSAEFNSHVADTWKSSASTWSKLNETSAKFVDGMVKTAWHMTKNVVAHTSFGVVSGFAAGSALFDKNGRVQPGKDKQVSSGNGIQTTVSLERGSYGAGSGVKTEVTRPELNLLQKDDLTGAQVVGDRSGRGPLLMMS